MPVDIVTRFAAPTLAFVVATACGPGTPLESAVVLGPAVVIAPADFELDAIGARAEFTATVLDADGRPIPGAAVTWMSRDTTIVTIADGIGLARRNGRTTITATWDTLIGESEVRVRQVGVTLYKVSGDAQVGTVGFPLARPLVAHVDDRLQNPVQGVTVYFRIVSGAGMLSDVSPATNAQGIAQTTWTLGPEAGDQIVAASLTPGAVTPALYNATATVR